MPISPKLAQLALMAALIAPVPAVARVHVHLHPTVHDRSAQPQAKPSDNAAAPDGADLWSVSSDEKDAGSKAAGNQAMGLIGGVAVMMGGLGVIGFALLRRNRA
ncbi:MAG: hypothetical protein JSS36_08310 [Proteobacteria bacterium]|nr:hypothetical protein [Pseudomonadota bacterium]